MNKDPKKIYCEWLDASTHAGWHKAEETDLVLVKTLGWLMFEDKEKITVAASYDENRYCVSSNTIPKKWIKKRRYIR